MNSKFPLMDVIAEFNDESGRNTYCREPLKNHQILHYIGNIMDKYKFCLNDIIINFLQGLNNDIPICIFGLLGFCTPESCKDCQIIKDSSDDDIWKLWIKQEKPNINGQKSSNLNNSKYIEQRNSNSNIKKLSKPFYLVEPNNFYPNNSANMNPESQVYPFIQMKNIHPIYQNFPEQQIMPPQMYMPPMNNNVRVPFSTMGNFFPNDMIPNTHHGIERNAHKPVPCKFGNNCKNKNCSFLHPDQNNCSFDEGHVKKNYSHKHPRIPSENNFSMDRKTSSNNFGKNKEKRTSKPFKNPNPNTQDNQ